jgi:hypothetical protein
VTKFWNATAELMGEGEGASSKSNSRYLTDFEELSLLGMLMADPSLDSSLPRGPSFGDINLIDKGFILYVNGTYAGFTVSLLLLSCDELSAGEGGFGHVVLCKNKLDGRRYAMKKILLKDKTLSQNNKILRLHHHLYSMLAVKGIEECVNFSEANDVCRAIQSPILFNCV